jgi:predicted tellurium resistance membrane protein TerC
VFDALADPQIWIALLTLTVLEIVLGIDNIIFISILSGKLPAEQQNRARIVGLSAAMLMRILLLFTISWVIGLTAPLFEVLGMEISGRDLILIGGGLFLLGKATLEIHGKLEGEEHATGAGVKVTSFASVIVQIMLLDIVFSLDSVITAVGMAEDLWVMVTAVVIAVGVMLISSGAISDFVNRHPTVKILALSFLLLIGTSLVAEGLEFHIPKGYIYFAMAFSVFVELINLRVRGKAEPVHLRDPYRVTEPASAGPTPPLGAPGSTATQDR